MILAGSIEMPISCMAFGCTNKQKSQEKKGAGASSGVKSSENNEISSLKQNIAFHRYVFCISCQQIPRQVRPKTVYYTTVFFKENMEMVNNI